MATGPSEEPGPQAHAGWSVPERAGRSRRLEARPWPSPAEPSFVPLRGVGLATAGLLAARAVLAVALPVASLAGAGGTGLRSWALIDGVGTLAAVAWLGWFTLAYRNLRALGEPTERALPWAPLSWCVPLLNLVWPYRILVELYRRSAGRGADSAPQPVAPPWLTPWWGVWVASVALGALGALAAPVIDAWAIAAALADALFAAGAAWIALDVSSIQTRRDAQLRGLVAPTPF